MLVSISLHDDLHLPPTEKLVIVNVCVILEITNVCRYKVGKPGKAQQTAQRQPSDGD